MCKQIGCFVHYLVNHHYTRHSKAAHVFKLACSFEFSELKHRRRYLNLNIHWDDFNGGQERYHIMGWMQTHTDQAKLNQLATGLEIKQSQCLKHFVSNAFVHYSVIYSTLIPDWRLFLLYNYEEGGFLLGFCDAQATRKFQIFPATSQ